MRTISAPLTETGDVLPGILPSTSMPFTGDPVVVYCRETESFFDGQVVVTEHLVYSVLVGEKRSGRFRRRIARASGPSNAERGEETARRIVEVMEGNGKMSSAEIASTLGMSRTAISLHLRRGLAPLVRRSTGPNNCAMWELVA